MSTFSQGLSKHCTLTLSYTLRACIDGMNETSHAADAHAEELSYLPCPSCTQILSLAVPAGTTAPISYLS